MKTLRDFLEKKKEKEGEASFLPYDMWQI